MLSELETQVAAQPTKIGDATEQASIAARLEASTVAAPSGAITVPAPLEASTEKASAAAPLPPPIVQLPVDAIASPSAAVDVDAVASVDSVESASYWLYWRCVEAVLTMASPLDALKLSVIVLKIVCQLEQDYDHEARDMTTFANVFFSAFDKTVTAKRDMNFIFELDERLEDMIDDMNLDENTLREHHKSA